MRGRILLPASLALLAASILITLAGGAPQRLPGIALGSNELLHIERVLAVFASGFVVLSVLIRASKGEVPTEFGTSGVRYVAEVSDEALEGVRRLEKQREKDRQAIDGLIESLQGLESRFNEFSPGKDVE